MVEKSTKSKAFKVIKVIGIIIGIIVLSPDHFVRKQPSYSVWQPS